MPKLRLEVPGPTTDEFEMWLDDEPFSADITDMVLWLRPSRPNRVEVGMLCTGLELLEILGELEFTVSHIPNCEHPICPDCRRQMTKMYPIQHDGMPSFPRWVCECPAGTQEDGR